MTKSANQPNTNQIENYIEILSINSMSLIIMNEWFHNIIDYKIWV